MQIEMTIKGLMVDPITNMPIIILRDKEGQRVLPIWVGGFEANAIALPSENVTTPRPRAAERRHRAGAPDQGAHFCRRGCHRQRQDALPHPGQVGYGAPPAVARESR